ncbi:ArsO family NAD(P)H-dependent flavin-containing monooxygenase [Aquincola tertiaricarbonis]|uniref:ArsO family NAD(P)H-dependent flavin-containing monooxygenase n=1 Tax=Aquincola tertiaricarbonis TaxID=391953 RepID=UPI000614E210|nr:ArsO family NAD(P)H-dependent flavin-containing monooxygenase [Aquincola tertiaricarbonis]
MDSTAASTEVDVAVIGGGQAGLSVGYFLRRTRRSFCILDAEPAPGGAWRHAWPSLRLFSPASSSSLAGWMMPATAQAEPQRDEVIDYLARYEARYALPVRRPWQVRAVTDEGSHLQLQAEAADGSRHGWRARAVVSATGTWREPYRPQYPGQALYRGRQLHSADYAGPDGLAGQRVLVVGGGNSGAQILAELSQAAQAVWCTAAPPRFLPDEVDGRVLFERATQRWRALQQGLVPDDPPGGLGDIVMVASVREARARGVLVARPMFERFTATGVRWPDGVQQDFDAVVWCTGFRPALRHLQPLGVVDAQARVAVQGTRSSLQPRLWLVGYGEWTGMASATLIGVMRTARSTAQEVEGFLAL